MRKFIISAGVVIVFLSYSFFIRHHHSSPVIAPPSLKQSNTSAGSSTGSQTSNTSSNTSSGSSTSTSAAKYKDGTYIGSVANAFYGNVQVSATISGGKIKSVDVLQSPNENPNSQYINSQALPYLKQETIKAQSANIDSISGATLTSQAFFQSISSALSKAH